MNTIREVTKINEEELQRGIAGTSASWHAQYRNSAWIYVGNLDHSLVEGDVICALSQYGEIDDFSLVRDEETGKSRGFAFCKYADARSCVLAVDNFCGIELCGRSMRVDHVENYRLPKHLLEKEQQEGGNVDVLKPGAAYQGKELASKYSLEKGQDLFAPHTKDDESSASEDDDKDSSASSSAHDSNRESNGKKNDKQARRMRKEERRLKREAKAERQRQREERRTKREEDRRKKRARQVAKDDDQHSKDDGRDLYESEDEKRGKKKTKKKQKRHGSSRSRKRPSKEDEEENDGDDDRSLDGVPSSRDRRRSKKKRKSRKSELRNDEDD